MSALPHTTLAAIRQACTTTQYRRVARALGGVRQVGAKTPLELSTVLWLQGGNQFDWINLLGSAQWPSANAARALAADLADLARPLYEYHWGGCGAVRQAIETARAFARGEATKSTLGFAYRAAHLAAKRTVIGGRFRLADHHAADAALWAASPFEMPAKIVECAYRCALLAYWEGPHDTSSRLAEALSEVVDANDRVFEALKPHFEDRPKWLAIYHERIAAACFKQWERQTMRGAEWDFQALAWPVIERHLKGNVGDASVEGDAS